LLAEKNKRYFHDIKFKITNSCPGKLYLILIIVLLLISNVIVYKMNANLCEQVEAEPIDDTHPVKAKWGGDGALHLPNMTVYEAHTSLKLKSEGPHFIPNANHSVEVNGKKLTVDDIVFGYDLLFQEAHMFSMAHFMGMYLQQDPNDAFALHDLFWRLQPDLLIELGTDTGGSAIFFSSFMRVYNPESLIITIDPRNGIEEGSWDRGAKSLCPDCIMSAKEHFLWDPKYIHFIQGVPSKQSTVDRVRKIIEERGFERIVVMDDCSHAYQHVLDNMNAYEQFVTVGSYLIVQDTKLDRMGRHSAMAAVKTFMENQGRDRYVRDNQWEYFLFSHHHGGFLKKIKE